MILTDVPPLDDKARVNWQQVTGVHLANEVINSIGSTMVKVDVRMISQDPPYEERTRRLRRLQSDQQEEITFDADYTIQSPTEVNVEQFVTGAFVSNYKKAMYLEQLKEVGGPTFQNASYVSVEPTFTVSRAKGNDAGSPAGDPTNIGLIVGVATAGLVVLILGLSLYARRRKHRSARAAKTPRVSNKLSDKNVPDLPTAPSAYGASEDEESLYTSHPTHKVAPNGNSSSHLTSSFSGEASENNSATSSTLSSDYNYRDAFKNISKSVVSGTLGSASNTASLEDPPTECEEYTVDAPRGKLGLILETSDQGCPIVQEIKLTSPLNGKVQVGDRLHSVDGRDVTMVMSETVSRVIASKQNHNVRKFVFARPQVKK